MLKYVVMVVSLIGAAVAITLSTRNIKKQPVQKPFKEPPHNPYRQSIGCAGIVEAASQNVVIGVSEAGRVVKVFVHRGDKVKVGDPLLRTDTSNLEAQRVVAVAAVATANAALERVSAYQRPENGEVLRAQQAQALAQQHETEHSVVEAQFTAAQQEWLVKDLEDQVARLDLTVKSHASPEQDLIHARFLLGAAQENANLLKQKIDTARLHVVTATAATQLAQANLDVFLGGAWKPDLAAAKASVLQAEAQLKQIDLQIERCTVRAPLDAVVLRQEIHEGEYATTTDPLADSGNVGIVLGNLDHLNIRVDVDEFDAQRFKPGMKAKALYKTGEGEPIELDFVRVDPFIIPKRALTNSQSELVDTRVLQIVYTVATPNSNLYVGQQVDVYIDTEGQHQP